MDCSVCIFGVQRGRAGIHGHPPGWARWKWSSWVGFLVGGSRLGSGLGNHVAFLAVPVPLCRWLLGALGAVPYWLSLGSPCTSPRPGDANAMVQNEPGAFLAGSCLLGTTGWDFAGKRQPLPSAQQPPTLAPRGHRSWPGLNGQGAELLGIGVT